jgi:hypothetical protein
MELLIFLLCGVCLLGWSLCVAAGRADEEARRHRRDRDV